MIGVVWMLNCFTCMTVDTCRGSYGGLYSQGNGTRSRHTGIVCWVFLLVVDWEADVMITLLVFKAHKWFPWSNAGQNECQGLFLEPQNGKWAPPGSLWWKGMKTILWSLDEDLYKLVDVGNANYFPSNSLHNFTYFG